MILLTKSALYTTMVCTVRTATHNSNDTKSICCCLFELTLLWQEKNLKSLLLLTALTMTNVLSFSNKYFLRVFLMLLFKLLSIRFLCFTLTNVIINEQFIKSSKLRYIMFIKFCKIYAYHLESIVLMIWILYLY